MDREVSRALHALVDLAVVRDVRYVAAVGEKNAALRCHAAPPPRAWGCWAWRHSWREWCAKLDGAVQTQALGLTEVFPVDLLVLRWSFWIL